MNLANARYANLRGKKVRPALCALVMAALPMAGIGAEETKPVPPTPPQVTPPAPSGAGATPAPAPAAADATLTKVVPGRFSMKVPPNMFVFAEDSADKNRLAGKHMKAAVNGVVFSVIASKAAAVDLDESVDKAVEMTIERPKLEKLTKEEVTFAGHKGYKYVFSSAVKDKPTIYISYFLRDDERVYIFTASVYLTHREQFEKIFDAMALSIVKDNTPPDAKPDEQK